MRSLSIIKYVLPALVLVAAVAVSAAFGQVKLKRDDATEEEQQAARAMWAQAIAAKGGRERLHAVRNLAVIRQFVMTSEGKKYDVSEEKFYAFPDRMYERDHIHDRTGPYSRLKVHACDFRVPVCWEQTNLREPYRLPDVSKEATPSGWFYLMETKWEQPKPLRTFTERVGFTKYDVVQTVVRNLRVDFYLDRQTHLPALIKQYSVTYGNERVGAGTFRFDDYVNVNGVMMPQKLTMGSPQPQRLVYQIDVPYDESIFGRPSMTDLGQEAWRVRRQ